MKKKNSQANATAIITATYYDSLKLYNESMHTEFDRNESHFDEIGLQKIHNNAKHSAMLKVMKIIILHEINKLQ